MCNMIKMSRCKQIAFDWNEWIMRYSLTSITLILDDIEAGRTKVDKGTIEALHFYKSKLIEGKKYLY